MKNLKQTLSSLLPAGRKVATQAIPSRRPGGDTLELFLPARAEATISWCRRSAGSIVEQGQTEDLASLAEKRKGARVIVLTSPADTLLTKVTVPTKSRNKILRALPYVLEDQLLGEPDAQHYVYHTIKGTELAVAVTLRETMQNTMQRLAKAGLHPILMSPANLALSGSDKSWTVYFSDKDIWIRTGKFSGMMISGDSAVASSILSLALNEAEKRKLLPDELVLINKPDELLEHALTQNRQLSIITKNLSLWEVLDSRYCEFNLLQGEFIPAKEANPVVTRLKPAFMLLLAWIVLSVIMTSWEWISLTRAQKQVRAQMLALYKQTFPNENVTGDPMLLMQSKVKEMQSAGGGFSDNDFLALLSASTPALQASASSKLHGIKYDQSGLIFNVNLPDYQSMESLKNRLTSSGLAVEVLSANSGSSGVESRLRVSSTGE
ncbi:MAG: type II secretion system protein GspL [Gammaproteobacteria bacterium]|nr:type II secretion system protein GspL [Gammaproteobacteria bacterium]